MIAERAFALIACMALASCGLPRGAGFQSEVLAASNANTAAPGEEAVYDFAVYEVNRKTLPQLQAWPRSRGALPWPSSVEQPASLMISPGDQVQLTIWDAEENSIFGPTGVTALQPTEVTPDGRIFVPFIGELKISGMSPTTARQRIEEELVRTVPSAQVQLVVEPGRENTVNLVSGFNAPGLYPLANRNVKILEVFSSAGGPAADLNAPQVRLVRGGRTYGIPFERLIKEPQLNTTLRGGDRLYVEGDDRNFISLGATGTQSIFEFPEAEFSALEALSLMGGVNGATANPESVLVMREYPANAVGDGVSGPPKQRVVFTIDLTTADGLFSARRLMLADGDLIYGTESALGPALTIFNLGNSLASTVN
ncbi:MAG: polysaccharide biosynthesis/export family protein [Yoonia sp.]|uniref:polysaccharide biosynthesis/export family protein n=1 Tax=Yoonia sp. TaxID=2212373 RepID=UPI003EF360D6